MRCRFVAVLLVGAGVALPARGEAIGAERLLSIGTCGRVVVAPGDCDDAVRALGEADATLRLAGALALAAGAASHPIPVEAVAGALDQHADDEFLAAILSDALSNAVRAAPRASASPSQPATGALTNPGQVSSAPEVPASQEALSQALARGDVAAIEAMARTLAGMDEGPAALDAAMATDDAAHREAMLRGVADAPGLWDELVTPRLLREAVRLAGTPPTMDDVEQAFSWQVSCVHAPDPHLPSAELAVRFLETVTVERIAPLAGDADPALARAARLVMAEKLAAEWLPSWDRRLLDLARDPNPAMRVAGLLALRASLDAWAATQAESPRAVGPRDRALVAEARRAIADDDPVLRHAGALVLLEGLETFPTLRPRPTRALEARAVDPPATRAALAAIRFALMPSAATLRAAFVARLEHDDGQPGRLRFLMSDRFDWQGAVASIMAASDGPLFVEACRHSSDIAADRQPVEACAQRLSSPDAEVRVSAATCLAGAWPRSREFVEAMIDALERAPTPEERRDHLLVLARVSPTDLRLHERLAAIARRLDLESWLDPYPLRGLSEEQLEAALGSVDEGLRKRAAEAFVRDAPTFGAAVGQARRLLALGRDAEGAEALLALISREDRDFVVIEQLDLSACGPVVRGRRAELLALYRRDRVRDVELARGLMRAVDAEERLSGLRNWRLLGPDAALDPALCDDPDDRVRAELAGLLGAGRRVEGDDGEQLACVAAVLQHEDASWRGFVTEAGRWRPKLDEAAAWSLASVVLPLVLSRAREVSAADREVRAGLHHLAGPRLRSSAALAEADSGRADGGR